VNGALPVLDILNGLVGAAGGAVAGSAPEMVTGTELNNNSASTQAVTDLFGRQTTDYTTGNTTNRPKAFINYIFFDEHYVGDFADSVKIENTNLLTDFK